MNDLATLLAGQTYRVARPFTDAWGGAHEPQDEWLFLGAERSLKGELVILHVRRPDGALDRIGLDPGDPAQAEVLAYPDDAFSRLEVLPWEHRLRCACDGPGMAQQGPGDPDLVVLACPRCRLLVCAAPAGDAGLRPLPLDEAARTLLWQALDLDPRAPLTLRLETAIACATEPAAARVLARKLWGQPDFASELCGFLRGPAPRERLLALDLVARTSPVPERVACAVTEALRNPIDPSPLSDETVQVLCATYNVAAEASSFRDVVARIRRAVKGAGGERGDLVRRLADAVLRRMDEHLGQAQASFRARHERLQGRVLAGDLPGAEQLLQELVDDPYFDTAAAARGALCEAAGDALAAGHPGHARWFYARAEQQYRIHASGASSGGEGMARMLDVNRLLAKLR